MTIVVIDPEQCPDCGHALYPVLFDQPALFRHGGYGATTRTEYVCCEECGWSLQRERSERRP